jgi:hypothetical protein
MKNVLAVLALLLWVPFAFAQTPTVQSVTVNDYGTYAFDVQTVDGTDSTGVAPQRTVTNIRQISTTRIATLPKPGAELHLGFHFTINGSPEGANVDIHFIRTTDNGKTVLSDATIQRQIGWTYYRGFTISGDDQPVPCVETVQVWYGNQLLASQSFTLVN